VPYFSKVNKLNDFAFKRIFGHEANKDILAGFLSDTLGEEIKPEDIVLENTELSASQITKKMPRLDIFVNKIRDNKIIDRIDIEVHLDDAIALKNQVLFYWGKGFTGDLRKGQSYNELPRMVSILIGSFNLGVVSPEAALFHDTFHVRSDITGKLYNDKLELHIINLKNLPSVEEGQLGAVIERNPLAPW
jgi:predicted transposase/invertase (TIGR01784 family)